MHKNSSKFDLITVTSYDGTSGLGDEAGVSCLEIHWPGGQVQVLHDVMPDLILKVREPK